MRGQRDEGRARRWGLLGALLGACLALGVVAAPAGAEYVQLGTVGDGDTLKVPTGVAIDEDTKDLYVGSFAEPSETGAPRGRAVKYDGTGEPVNLLRPGTWIGSVAVNQMNGNVFIMGTDTAETPTPPPNTRPLGSFFNSDGEQLGSTFPLGTAAGPTAVLVQTAMDDSEIVYFPDFVNGGILEYNSSGQSQGTITGEGENLIRKPRSVALDDAGNIYVADKGIDDNETPEEPSDDTEFPRVQKFNSAGVFQEVISQEDEEVGVAVDAATGNVFVGKSAGETFRVTVYDSSGNEIDEFGEGLFAPNPFGVAIGQITVDSTTGRAYVTDQGANTVRVFGEPQVPTATTGSASAVTPTSAALEGEINPGGAETACLFLYGEAGGPLEEEAPCEADPVEGIFAVEVSADVTGLDPNTEYEFKLSAENSEGPDEGAIESFTTLPNPPVATTGSAGGVTQTAATLNATVNANDGNASCVFQYGTSTAYGSTVPCSVNPVTGSAATAVSAALSGLTPGTTYHFRVVAENDGGKVNGLNQTFTTAAHTCETDASLCPKPAPPVAPALVPPVPAPPATKPKPLKCKKGFKKKTVKGKQKCVKAKKKGKKK